LSCFYRFCKPWIQWQNVMLFGPHKRISSRAQYATLQKKILTFKFPRVIWKMCIFPGLQQSSSGSTGFECCTSSKVSSAGPHTGRGWRCSKGTITTPQRDERQCRPSRTKHTLHLKAPTINTKGHYPSPPKTRFCRQIRRLTTPARAHGRKKTKDREQQQETRKKGCMDEIYSSTYIKMNEKARNDFHHVNFWRVGKGALFLFLFFFLLFVDIWNYHVI
jgi:hypothetical protein